jgi:hypothetical protein
MVRMNYEKKCPRCGEVKPLTKQYWYGNASIRTGLSGYCKTCTLKMNLEHPESKRNWYERNRDRIRAYQKKYLARERALLKDTYIKRQLVERGIQPSQEMISLERAILKLKRNLKKLREILNGPTNEGFGRKQQENGKNTEREIQQG